MQTPLTFDIALVLGILVVSFILFVSERLRMDLVALLVLATLALTRQVSFNAALAGFSNPAVVTVWGMFILSAGLTATGVAEMLGRRILGLAGRGERTAIVVVMLTAGVLSAFMSNIGVAALMLPVVIDIARRTGTSPSRLLMPLAYGSLLGGLTTLIGTPPNLLVSNALREAGRTPFSLFEFTPVGGVVLLAGCAFIVLVGRRWLPARDPTGESAPRDPDALRRLYGMDRRSVVLRLPPGSELDGKPLRHSRLGAATGLNVYAIVRNGDLDVAPDPGRILRAGDRLLVHGKLDRFEELRAWRELIVQPRAVSLGDVVSETVGLCEARVPSGSDLQGKTIGRAALRRQYDVTVLALRRGERVVHTGLVDTALQADDELLLQGPRAALEPLRDKAGLEILDARTSGELLERYHLRDRLFAVRVPEESVLVGSNLEVSRLGDAAGFGVLALVRGGETLASPSADEVLQAGDELLVRGDPSEIEVFRGLQKLELETEKTSRNLLLDSGEMRYIEATPAPLSAIVGRTPKELRFRDKYGVQLVAVLRRGQARYSNLGAMRIELGDALLCLGPRKRAEALQQDPDLLILNPEVWDAPRRSKALAAGTIMAGVVVSALVGWLPISVAAVTGAALMVLFGCLTMEQAYRAIEWRAVFLIAGMLPLGTAMQESGAASYVANGVVAALGPLGPWGVVCGLYVVTALLTMDVPTAALVVLIAPIALDSAALLGLSDRALMMAIAMAASASFTSPVSHPANILVMGPGGYRFADYVKLGVPLTLVVMAVVLLVLPFFFPLQP